MEKFVDVKSLIAEKNANALKWIPGFIIRYLEHIIHQEEVNEFFIKQKGRTAYEFCDACMKEFGITLHMEGQENVIRPPESCIFVSNHPLGGFDAVAVVSELSEIRPDIKFIVNDFLMTIENLKGHFVGVNKVGKSAKDSLRKVDELFASDAATFIFPAGLVSRKINGKVRDLEWKKTFVSKSKKYKKPVIPVYIEGRLTNRFYRIAKWRKFFRIKLNIEMLYLVDELFKQKGTEMKIRIGQPIDYTTFDKSKKEYDWAQWVKAKVYEMA